MAKIFANSGEIFLLAVLSFVARFWNLAYPARVVFDEAHFGLYATKYLSGQYYVDIHPPLGKLLFALAAFFGGVKPGFDFAPNSAYGDFNFLAMRFAPALFGSLLIPLIVLLVREMGFPRRAAFLAGFMVLFENALIVESRFMLMDIILLFFIFLSLYLFFLSRRFKPFSLKWWVINILCGLAIGAAISTKWTGLGILGLIVLWLLRDYFKKPCRKEVIITAGLVAIIPFLIYFLVFALHFSLIPNTCVENCGYVLESNKEYHSFYNSPPAQNGFTANFIKTNSWMLMGNIGMKEPYPFQSNWFEWPVMRGFVLYYNSYAIADIPRQEKTVSIINFSGNPLIWWLGTASVILSLCALIKNYLPGKSKPPAALRSKKTLFLLTGYFFYLLPYAAITRPMMIYHYLPALVFSIIILAAIFDDILRIASGETDHKKLFFADWKINIVFIGLILVIFSSFMMFMPLTYGL